MLAWTVAVGLSVLVGRARRSGSSAARRWPCSSAALPADVAAGVRARRARRALAAAPADRRVGSAWSSLTSSSSPRRSAPSRCRPTADAAPQLRVVVSNLYVLNPDPAEAGRFLRGLDADVVVVPELDARGLRGLRRSGLLEDLPHVVAELGTRDETVGLLSRLPLAGRVDPAGRRPGAAARDRRRRRDARAPARRAHAAAAVGVRGAVARRARPTSRRRCGPSSCRSSCSATSTPTATTRRSAGCSTPGLRDAHDERGRGLARTFPVVAAGAAPRPRPRAGRRRRAARRPRRPRGAACPAATTSRSSPTSPSVG